MTTSLLWQIFYWLWVATEVSVALITRTRRSSGEVRDQGSMLVLWVVIFLSITAGFSIAAATHPTIFGGAHWVYTASLVVMIVGLTIRWVSIFSLGRSFSVNVAIHATQTLHKTGLFRIVRHPSYSGLLLIFFALGLRTRNWLALAVMMIPTLAALLYRIHVEEAALSDAFGEQYLEYSRQTKRLIPGIY
jgi:protein-S-isoprenylcysteine O-methyltransferase Ste14